MQASLRGRKAVPSSVHGGGVVQYEHLMQASLRRRRAVQWVLQRQQTTQSSLRGRKAVQAFLQGRKAVDQWPLVLMVEGKRGEFVVIVAAGEGRHRAAWTLLFDEFTAVFLRSL